MSRLEQIVEESWTIRRVETYLFLFKIHFRYYEDKGSYLFFFVIFKKTYSSFFPPCWISIVLRSWPWIELFFILYSNEWIIFNLLPIVNYSMNILHYFRCDLTKPWHLKRKHLYFWISKIMFFHQFYSRYNVYIV